MVKIASFQIKLRDIKENFEKIREFGEKLSDENVEILCLPEKWNATSSPPETISDESSFLKEIANFAKKYNIYVVLGALAEKAQEKIYVTAYLIDKKGEIMGKQRKIHLYSFEAKKFSKGSEFKVFETDFGKIGIAVCFDLNAFPEVGRAFAIKGTDIIFNPVMVFEEGIENWHIYLKSRALENRMPIVGVNSVGKSPMGNNLTGESLIIGFKKGYESPAKLKLSYGKKGKEEMIITNIDLDYPRKIRAKRLAEIQEFKMV